MKLILCLEEQFKVGEEAFFDSVSPNDEFAVVFEDNCETGYFYALGMKIENEQRILDAVHIYDDESVVDKLIPSTIKIAWTDDGMIASLLINNYCHAIFDFKKKAGYCRNGFPESRTDWTRKALTDELINKIFES